MDNRDLIYWLALKWVEGIGNIGFKTLVDAFGSPKEVFESPINILRALPGIGSKTASRIKAFNDWQKIEKEIKLADKNDVSIITYLDDSYPKALLNIYDFPPLLYVKGSLQNDDVNIAVIGSRMASTYGKYSTERLCRELAFQGITVVSGMARGIDSAAHRGALAGKGRTIAVFGCGMDIIYPPENEKLFKEISTHGAVITEFPFGTPPNGPNFPARNRIISGISLGVVVVEASDKSGSLITARIALEQGREVFAVPGSIDSAGSRGTHKLIKQGAKLIESVRDILDEIIPQVDIEMNSTRLYSSSKVSRQSDPNNHISIKGTELTDQENAVLNQITNDPVNVDSIIASSGLKSGNVLNILMFLELKGIIRQLPGKMFIRRE